MTKFGIVTFFLLLSQGCMSPKSPVMPEVTAAELASLESNSATQIYPSNEWHFLKNPAQSGWSEAGLQKANAFLKKMNTTSAIVVWRGVVVAQYGTTAKPEEVLSVRKSLLSAMYGKHVKSGEIALDDTLSKLNINDKMPLTTQEKQARVIDILSARSGIYLPSALATHEMKSEIKNRGKYKPGERFFYHNWDLNTAGMIFEKQTGLKIPEAFEREIARPLQFQDHKTDNAFYETISESTHKAYNFCISARDLARIGLLVLNKGKWQKNEVIPADWVGKMTTAQTPPDESGKSFGLMWWVLSKPEHRNASLMQNSPYAAGSGGQFVQLIPSRDLVIVHNVNPGGFFGYGKRKVSRQEFNEFVDLILDAYKQP